MFAGILLAMGESQKLNDRYGMLDSLFELFIFIKIETSIFSIEKQKFEKSIDFGILKRKALIGQV